MAHHVDCDFEAGKRECEVFYYNSYIRHIHNESQRHIIVHTGLTTDFKSSCSTSKPYLIFTCVI